MGRFPVSEAREKALRERMEGLGLLEDDIEEQFVRSGGRGGQRARRGSTAFMHGSSLRTRWTRSLTRKRAKSSRG
jgi:hypothetical protein